MRSGVMDVLRRSILAGQEGGIGTRDEGVGWFIVVRTSQDCMARTSRISEKMIRAESARSVRYRLGVGNA